MKKLILSTLILCVSFQIYAQPVPVKFAADLDQISTQYSKDMHHFLSTLTPTTVQFNLQQQAQYCAIVATYVDDFYALTDKNRASLPLSYANVTKQDVIVRVKQSKEMQILEKYNIQCDLG